MLVLSNHPLKEQRQNYLSQGLAGEAVILVMQDLLMIATDSQVIPEHRQVIGWVIIYVMALNIIFAVGIMLNESIRETIRQIKMKKKRKLAVKTMNEKKAAYELKAIAKAATVQAKPLCPPLSPIKEESESSELRDDPPYVSAKFREDQLIRDNNNGVQAVIHP